MKHKRFEENILVDEAYTNYNRVDKNEDKKKSTGIAKHFAQTLEYDEKKKWYHQLPEESSVNKPLSQEKIEELRKEASSALHGDTLAYETKSNRSGSSDQQWARTLLNKGAIGDRVAAATILIQDNPLYNLTALTNMINQVKPAKKKDGIVVIDALSELLISELLIPDMKLRTFEQHALTNIDELSSGNKQTRRGILKLWYYEDRLKELYGTYVEALNKFAHDSVDSNKEKAVSAMSYLLMHHPEREKMLLSNIINKLGDPSQCVASKVIYHLCQLLYNHPNMKAVVLLEIEKMLFRTNISPRAQYYGLCFLNQFYLGKDDSKIAEDLIRIYFSFFTAATKKGDIERRVMSAILTGAKRAYPFAERSRDETLARHSEAVYRLLHLAPPSTAAAALALLAAAVGPATGDRFYSALYRKLSSPELFNTAHSALLFNVVYKSVRQDTDIPRVCAFIKRLLQLCCYMTPAQACGILFLISQVLKDSKKKDAIKIVWTKKDDEEEEIKEDKVEDKSKEAEDTSAELNTEAQPKENDTEVNKEDNTEVKKDDDSDVKKEVKVDLLIGDKKDLWNDDEDECYQDLKLDEAGHAIPSHRKVPPSATGWYHAKVFNTGVTTDTQDVKDDEKLLAAKIQLKRTVNMHRSITRYDPYARNPSFSGAETSAYLELTILARHHHPTVQLFATRILQDQIIKYTGDPLKDFAGIRFLDRFVFKNPKRRGELEQESDGLKKVKGSHPKFAVRKNYVAKGIRSIPVNSSTYLNEDVKNIPVDERFLYDYLQKRRETSEKEDEDDVSDDDSVTSEDFNKYMDSLGGAANEDSDQELDFMSEMNTSKQRKKNTKQDESDDELDEDDDEDEADAADHGDDDDDGGLDFGDDEELLLEGSEDDDDQIDVPDKKSGRGNLKLKLKGKDDLGSLFASAEEFSTLLEDTATNTKQGLSSAVSNVDNSSVKQLAWEEKRNWMKTYNRKMHGDKDRRGGKRKRANVSGAKNKKFKK